MPGFAIQGANAQKMNTLELSQRLGEHIAWGDGFWVDDPERGGFAVKYGFAMVYDSTDFSPRSKKRPLYTVLGPPIENEHAQRGRSVQEFRDGWLTYSESEDMRVQLKLAPNHSIQVEGGAIHRFHGSRNGERCDQNLDLPALIRSAYLSELGRREEPPLDRHLDSWGPRLEGKSADEARATIVGEMRKSAEYAGPPPLEQIVESVYWSELGRASDAPGHANWMAHAREQAAKGLGADQLRDWLVGHFRNSDEYRRKSTGGGPTEWGDAYFCHNARLEKQFQVKRGFAQVYEARHYFPETKGRPPYELLGPPTSEEQEIEKGSCVQTFERGRLTWSEVHGHRIELEAKPAEPKARIVLGEPRAIKPMSIGDIARLAGKPRLAPEMPRLRIAPSPSGFLHPGNLWMFLMNYLMSKQLGGELLLRIEDTDSASSRPEFVEAAKETLRWAGIQWKTDEVEQQSRRGDLYRRAVDKLVASGHAYSKNGAVYFRMPESGSLVVDDRVKGRVRVNLVDNDGMKDFVILRADGAATFPLANTIDDAEQRITHVVRGQEHLLNAARQICIYRALGYRVPEFYHLPPVMGDEGSAKLSKRDASTSVLALRDAGIAPEVLVNHLADLGARGPKSDGIKTIDELVAKFDRFALRKNLTRIGFDELLARNKQYIASLDHTQLRKLLESFDPDFMKTLDRARAAALVEGVRSRASTFREAIDIGRFTLSAPIYGEKSAARLSTPEVKAKIGALADALERMPAFGLGEIKAQLEAFNRGQKTSYRDYASALQWMLTGAEDGMPIESTLGLLGQREALERIRRVLAGTIELLPERDPAPSKPAPERAPSKNAAGKNVAAQPIAMSGAILQTYLKCAKLLGAPIGPAERGENGVVEQRFLRGRVNEYGQIKLEGRPSFFGPPFRVLDETNVDAHTWVDGAAPIASAEGLKATGNNHFHEPLGTIGQDGSNIRTISFKVFLKDPNAALLLQANIDQDWEHRWAIDGRNAYQGKFDWPRRGQTTNLPIGQWVDVRLDLIRDLGAVPGQKLIGLAFSSDGENISYSDVRIGSNRSSSLSEAYLHYHDTLGDPAGDPFVSPETGQWTQELERGWLRQDSQMMLKGHQHWLVNGKLDAWLRAPLVLGAPKGEAYIGEFGLWQQDFAGGQTNDSEWVKFGGHEFWLAGGILDAYVAHALALGKPTGAAIEKDGGGWIQSFEHGWADTTGAWGLGNPAARLPLSFTDYAADERRSIARALGEAEPAPAALPLDPRAAKDTLVAEIERAFVRLSQNREALAKFYGEFAVRALRPGVPLGGTLENPVHDANREQPTVEPHYGWARVGQLAEIRSELIFRVEQISRALPVSMVAEGKVIKARGTEARYLISGGARLRIPNSAAILEELGLRANDVTEVEPATLARIPAVPRNGALVRERNRPEVYEMRGGKRCHISTEEKLLANHTWAEVMIVPDDSLAEIPIGEVI